MAKTGNICSLAAVILLLLLGSVATAAAPVSPVDKLPQELQESMTAPVFDIQSHTYTPHLRVYIVEPTSRYLNHNNVPYENGFLDFAIDQDVNLTYQDTFSTTVTWVGSAHGFSNITENNILVIATVSDENWQWGYANPPHANPFHMYKGQAAAMALPGETGHDDHSGSYTHTVFVEEATATW